jgi:streptogramin lyase
MLLSSSQLSENMVRWKKLFAVFGLFLIIAISVFILYPKNGVTYLASTSKVNTFEHIREYSLGNDTGPNGITVDYKNRVWVVLNFKAELAELFPSNKTIVKFDIPVPKGTIIDSWGIVYDRFSDRVIFSDLSHDKIWVFTVPEKKFSSINLQSQTGPYQIVIDEKGNIWFTELYGNGIGEMMRNGTVREYKLQPSTKIMTQSTGPAGITIDTLGRIWFTQVYSNSIGCFSNGTFKFYTVKGLRSPVGITSDRQGRLWITQHGASYISVFDPESGKLNTYSTSLFGVQTTLPYFIVADKEGNIWFNEHYGNSIGEIIDSSNLMIEYKISSSVQNLLNISGAQTISLSPSGEVWFTELYTGNVGMVYNASNDIKILNQNQEITNVSGLVRASVNISFKSKYVVTENIFSYLQVTKNLKLSTNDGTYMLRANIEYNGNSTGFVTLSIASKFVIFSMLIEL